jgi:hypothetical protein
LAPVALQPAIVVVQSMFVQPGVLALSVHTFANVSDVEMSVFAWHSVLRTHAALRHETMTLGVAQCAASTDDAVAEKQAPSELQRPVRGLAP